MFNRLIQKLRKHRHLQRVIVYFRKDANPASLARNITIGILISISPFIGFTTASLALAAALFRLNFPFVLALSYLVYPLQLLLVVPYIRLGEELLEKEHMGMTLGSMKALFNEGFIYAMKELWQANVCGFASWFILSIPIGLAMYFLLVQFFRTMGNREESAVEHA